LKGGAYEESGRHWRAKDIGIKEKACVWMSHGFMSVNIKLGAGKAFLRSLYRQYAEWGVDFSKRIDFISVTFFIFIRYMIISILSHFLGL